MRPVRETVRARPGVFLATGLAVAAGLVPGGGEAFAQARTRSAITGPVTREAIVRGLSVVPDIGAIGRGEASVMLHIEFDLNSAELTAGARRALDRVAAALLDARLAAAPVTVEGHTDASGGDAYNRQLSRRRATAVATYLTQCGVAGSRLTAIGFGEERLLTDYQPTDSRQRRVEIVRTW